MIVATMAVLTKRGTERFTGVVAKADKSHKFETCGHHHKYEDLASICARRLQQKRGLWR